MAKPSKESFYAKLRKHAGINENTKIETTNYGTLIDNVRANDGTVYGIVKENHNYYIKKSNIQEGELDASDFAYIGGIQNKNDYKYSTVAEAQKQRNFYVTSINEAFSLKPKNVVNEEKEIEKVDNPFEYIKNRVNEGKTTNKVAYENKFKKNLKENTEKINKKSGLMSEEARTAIKKAMGLISEEKAISTEDSHVKEVDVVSEKTGKEASQAPINDTNAKQHAERAHAKDSFKSKEGGKDSIAVNQADENLKEEASPLVTDDSEIITGQSLANMDGSGKEASQAPINDTNAKQHADKASGHSASNESISNQTEEFKESDPLSDKEDVGDEKNDIVSEGAISTEDSEQKDVDKVSDSKKVTTKPEAPYNSYNQPEKGHKEEKGEELKPKESKKDIVAEEKDLSTADSEINAKESPANHATEPSTDSESITTKDSELDADKTLANHTKTNLPNPIAEGKKEDMDGDGDIDSDDYLAKKDAAIKANMNEDDLSTSDSEIDVENALPNEEIGDITYDRGELEDGVSFSMDDNAIAKEVEEDEKVASELDSAADALDDLGVAIDAEQENQPDMGSEEAPVEEPVPAPDMGSEEIPAEEPVPDMGGEEETGGEEVNADDLVTKEIEKLVGKVTQKVRNTDLTPDQTKSFMNSIITAFKSDLADVDSTERKEMADDIIKSDTGEEISADEPETETGGEEAPVEEPAPDMGGEEAPVEEAKENCNECGTFGTYAESRGYTTFEGATIGEVANVISSYANAYNEGMNDGDFEGTAPYMTEEIMTELKDYGHESYVSESLKKKEINEAQGVKFGTFEVMPPVPVDESELTEEELNELGWKDIAAGLGQAGSYVGGKVSDKAQQAQQALMGKVQKGVQKVKDVGTGIKQQYHKGAGNRILQDVNKQAAQIADTIKKFNDQAVKAGAQPIKPQSVLQTVANQLRLNRAADVSKYKMEGIEEGGEDFAGLAQDLGTGNTDDIKIHQDDEDLKQATFSPVAQNMGIGGMMGESEVKLRKYIKNKLEELAGIKKPIINENKSESLKKLDQLIVNQWESKKKS